MPPYLNKTIIDCGTAHSRMKCLFDGAIIPEENNEVRKTNS
jgi:hypothetical protein